MKPKSKRICPMHCRCPGCSGLRSAGSNIIPERGGSAIILLASLAFYGALVVGAVLQLGGSAQ